MPDYWWEASSGKTFWFETTDREDLGRDVTAPQLGEEGQPHWSYDFVRLVEQGEIGVHYRPELRAIPRVVVAAAAACALLLPLPSLAQWAVASAVYLALLLALRAVPWELLLLLPRRGSG